MRVQQQSSRFWEYFLPVPNESNGVNQRTTRVPGRESHLGVHNVKNEQVEWGSHVQHPTTGGFSCNETCADSRVRYQLGMLHRAQRAIVGVNSTRLEKLDKSKFPAKSPTKCQKHES